MSKPTPKKTPPLTPVMWQVLRDIQAGRGPWHDVDDRYAVQGRCYAVFGLYKRGLISVTNELLPPGAELLAAKATETA